MELEAMNLDQNIKREVEAVLGTYGKTLEEVFAIVCRNIALTGQLPIAIDADLEEIPGEFDWFDETEEEFFAKLEKAKEEADLGLTMTREELHR